MESIFTLSCHALSQNGCISACMWHTSVETLLQGFVCVLFWHALCRGSSSVSSPALSHLRSLICSSWGSSILCYTPMKQPAERLKTVDTIDTLDYVASGKRTDALFKETKPLCPSILNPPHPPPPRSPLFSRHTDI